MRQLPLVFKNAFFSQGLRQAAIMTGGNIFATGLSAISLILISRILGPEKFGEFSVGFSVVLILVRLNDAGLNTAIVRFVSSSQQIKDQKGIFAYTFKLKLVISVALMALGVILTPYLTSFFHLSSPYYFGIAFSLGLATTYFEQLLVTLQAIHSFGKAASINIAQAISKLTGLIIFFITGVTNPVLIFAYYVAAPTIPTLFAKKLLPSSFFPLDTGLKAEIKQKISLLSRHSAIALISAGIIENIDILFVQKNVQAYETGLYGGVARIALAFSLIAYSMADVLNARVARYHSKSDIDAYLKKVLLLLFATGIGFICFIPFSRLFILLTIGPEYLVATEALLVLVASSFLAIAAVPFIALFYSFKANWYFSVSGLSQLVIVIIGNSLLVPEFGLMGAAYTRLVTRLFLLLFTLTIGLYLYRRYYAQKTN